MAHHKLERNLTAMLYHALRDRRCDSSTSNLKLRVPSSTGGKATYYYPDAMIWCDPLDEGETDGHAWIERPSVIFEIISCQHSPIWTKAGSARHILAIGALDRLRAHRAGSPEK